jgi:divalent metal cation (Fe/Co/Zn/Cd) transporter
MDVSVTSQAGRRAVVVSGKRLEYFTIAWNTVEGLIGVFTGMLAGSISLVGFGIDSFIEVASAVTLLWRISADENPQRREQRERTALRIVGSSFIGLAAYIGYEALTDLIWKRAPQASLPGILLAIASLIAMPLLARAKKRVGTALGSRAMHADAKQAEFCTYLSAILLSGLLLNRLLGFWWADPIAGLVMVPIIAKEGYDGWHGKACDSCCC